MKAIKPKRQKKKILRTAVIKNSVYFIILAGLFLLMLIFLMYTPQSSQQPLSEVQRLLPPPPPIPGTDEQFLSRKDALQLPPPPPIPGEAYRDIVGQTIGVQTDPCSYADGGGTNCPKTYGIMNLRNPPFTFSTTTTGTTINRVSVVMPQPALDTFRYILYRYGYITKKVNNDYQWVPFEFTFQNERTIPFDNKESKDAQGRDIWIDVTNPGGDTAPLVAATADTAPELALTSLSNFYTDQPNYIVSWVCRCQGSDCNNRAKGWNSANWECNPRTLGTKGVNNGRWVLRQFDVLTDLLLTVVKSGSGAGYGLVTAQGINCGSDCSESYFGGPSVTLTATPNFNADSPAFGGWSGACTGTSTTCTIAVNAEKSVTATFTFNINQPVLRSVVLTESGTKVELSYTKNDIECSDLYNKNNPDQVIFPAHRSCSIGQITEIFPLPQGSPISVGDEVRLCQEKLPKDLCNQFVTVTSG